MIAKKKKLPLAARAAEIYRLQTEEVRLTGLVGHYKRAYQNTLENIAKLEEVIEASDKQIETVTTWADELEDEFHNLESKYNKGWFAHLKADFLARWNK